MAFKTRITDMLGIEHPIVQAMKHLLQKYIVERHIMDFVWNADHNETVRYDMEQHWGTFTGCDKAYFELDTHSDTVLIETTLDQNKSKGPKKTGKLQFALHSTLIMNAIKMFNLLGPNFVLTNKGETNQDAVLYLSGFPNAPNDEIQSFTTTSEMSGKGKYSFYLIIKLWADWVKTNIVVLESGAKRN